MEIKKFNIFINEGIISADDMLIKLNNEYYITNNDEIKTGDWFYCSDNTNYAHIFKCIGITEPEHLQVSNANIFGGYGPGNGSSYGDWFKYYSKKIIASTKKLDGIKHLIFKEADYLNL